MCPLNLNVKPSVLSGGFAPATAKKGSASLKNIKKSDIIALEIKDVILLSFIFLTKGFLTISIHLSNYLSRESDITLDVGTTFNIFCFSVMLCRDSNPSSTRQRADYTIVADYHSWLEDLLCIVLPLVAEFSRHYHLLDFLPNIVRGEEGERVGYLAGHL